MLAFLAASATERFSHFTIPLAGTMREIAVLFLAVPLAIPKPIVAPKEGVLLASTVSVRAPLTVTVVATVEQPASVQPDMPATLVSLSPREMATRVVPPEIKELAPAANVSEGAVAAAVTAEIAPKERPAAGTMEEVDEYLWEVYRRSPIKRDSTGDFTWKDPAAAQRFGISMPAYVIGGMDPDFREQLYHAGRAMDAAGIRWSIMSAFRDDYRQSLASGFKARIGYSLHGGSARTGGYGHGQAVDVAGEDGSASAVWQWIDKHGEKFGLYRPMPGADPPHIQPRSAWRELAVTLRNARAGSFMHAHAQGAKPVKTSAAAEAW
jgi:hypothetical protein